MLHRPKTLLIFALALAFGASLLTPQLNPYHLDVILTIGINIVLAVSLNLLNGYTGQFSLGHAGFMAIGAYGSAAFSLFATPVLFPTQTRGLLTPVFSLLSF